MPAAPVQLAPGLRRLTAPNPGPMTGAGTNSYLVGEAAVAVVDPGPDSPAHVAALLDAGAGRIRWIFTTHTHPDHSPATVALAAATGAEVIGLPPPAGDEHQDTGFCPHRRPADGEWFAGPDFHLQAIHTPGHVSNHVCYLHRESGLLLTGDHIMQGSTVVIIPPAGDMADYLQSLRKLLDLPLAGLAPGHGEVMAEPAAEIHRLIRHRQWREDKIAAVLQTHSGRLGQLVALAYDDVDPALHWVAQLSLHAHLLKLVAEGRAQECDGHFSPPA